MAACDHSVARPSSLRTAPFGRAEALMRFELAPIVCYDHINGPKASGLSVPKPLNLHFDPIARAEGAARKSGARQYGWGIAYEVPHAPSARSAVRPYDKDAMRIDVFELLDHALDGNGEEFVCRHRMVRARRAACDGQQASGHARDQRLAHGWLPDP
jgi:hypothetical protein